MNRKKQRVGLGSDVHKAKKSLGQNFIFDEALLSSLVDAAGVGKEDAVLEIGTGMGTLTKVLAEKCSRVLTVEIDDTLIPLLKVFTAQWENVLLVHDNILKMDLNHWTESLGPFHVVANIPYYLTTELLQKLFFSHLPILGIHIMVQKEAAERIVASPGDEGYCLLSLQRAYFGPARILREIPRTCFDPAPKVDSAFVTIERNHPLPFEGEFDLEKRFLKVASAAFSMRRKTFANNAAACLGMSKQQAEEWLGSCAIDPLRRGESLTLEEILRLCRFWPE